MIGEGALAAVLAAALGQRLFELRKAQRNARWLMARGARAVRPDGYAGIVFTHVAWFALLSGEAVARGTTLGWWSVVGGLMVVAGETLRYTAIGALGRRWHTRVYVLDDAPVRHGVYARMRHPNYIGVTLTLVGVPLAFGLWIALAAIVPLHATTIARRIAVESAAINA